MTTKKKILIAGSDSFISDRLDELIPDDENIEIKRYNEENFNIEEVVDFISTISLFYEDKYLIVKNIHKIKELEDSLNYFSGESEAHIVFTSENNNLIKLFKDHFEIIKETKHSYKDFVVQVMEIFKSKGVDIEFNEAKEIYELCGRNIDLIKQEAEKISIFFYNQKIESFDEILKLISSSNVNLVFKFLDSFYVRDKRKTLEYLNEMISAHENLMMVFYMLAKRANEMFYYKINPELVSGHAYKISQIKSAVSKWKLDELSQLIENLYFIDKKLKISTISLENELISLINSL
ncbi:hypothetical protein DEFDS_0792 [Deferribacter desulfuricans SSM1]|uniref:DNA-directed DNA polymerase n=1 Tax=Deferribacter desulfuricans (strain DSM 14783 / JCM 11476 / NBRC 101012 / SSM1) TaxID=639282 RepID=D3PCE7_DEFDS|nr:hypothetical protein [Deferribacter desulfuricans]BAI80270.1 hypothetical protein DEFDS_0792 [Deferribacter desulfuricans SSM1]